MKRILVPALAFTVVATSAACGSSDDSADPPPPPTTTSPTAADEQELRDLAEGWYETNKAIYRDGTDAVTSEQFLSGDYLDGFASQVDEFEGSGNQVRPDPRSSHTVESVDVNGDAGAVTECVVDADQLFDGAGEVINDAVEALRYETIADRTPDGWRFVDREIVGEWEGQTTCDK